MSISLAGIHRAARKEDIIKLKVQHLETTCKVCQEFSERVCCIMCSVVGVASHVVRVSIGRMGGTLGR